MASKNRPGDRRQFKWSLRLAAATAGSIVLGFSGPPATAAEPSPDFTSRQGYLNPAQHGGIGARYAWTQPGGKGENVTVLDVEYATWNLQHEDLPADTAYVPNGTGTPFDFSDDHGTRVIGIMAADDNGYGMTGIVPDAALRVVPHLTSQLGYSAGIASAVRTGITALERGDVMLIEANVGGPSGQNAPVEWVESIYDAIVEATDAGIIVVQTAGNGGQNLDASRPTFPGYGDSGAIIVGAGASPLSFAAPARSTLWFSNFGARVDLQGWGQDVASTGGGDLHGAAATPCNSSIPANRSRPTAHECADDAYTAQFGGTSGAGPIVAGAAAALSSVAQENGVLLSPREVREILVATGTPQKPEVGETSIDKPIGPLPDLEAAVAAFWARYDRDGDGIVDTDPPASPTDCRDGGWQEFNNPTFKNQGACVSYAVVAKPRRG